MREAPGLHERRAVPHDERDRAEDAEDDEGGQAGPPPHAAQHGLAIRIEPGAVALHFVAFVGEGLDVGDALEGFLDDRRALGEPVLRFA